MSAETNNDDKEKLTKISRASAILGVVAAMVLLHTGDSKNEDGSKEYPARNNEMNLINNVNSYKLSSDKDIEAYNAVHQSIQQPPDGPPDYTAPETFSSD